MKRQDKALGSEPLFKGSRSEEEAVDKVRRTRLRIAWEAPAGGPATALPSPPGRKSSVLPSGSTGCHLPTVSLEPPLEDLKSQSPGVWSVRAGRGQRCFERSSTVSCPGRVLAGEGVHHIGGRQHQGQARGPVERPD